MKKADGTRSVGAHTSENCINPYRRHVYMSSTPTNTVKQHKTTNSNPFPESSSRRHTDPLAICPRARTYVQVYVPRVLRTTKKSVTSPPLAGRILQSCEQNLAVHTRYTTIDIFLNDCACHRTMPFPKILPKLIEHN